MNPESNVIKRLGSFEDTHSQQNGGNIHTEDAPTKKAFQEDTTKVQVTKPTQTEEKKKEDPSTQQDKMTKEDVTKPVSAYYYIFPWASENNV